jgi:hypothetical protein
MPLVALMPAAKAKAGNEPSENREEPNAPWQPDEDDA